MATTDFTMVVPDQQRRARHAVRRTVGQGSAVRNSPGFPWVNRASPPGARGPSQVLDGALLDVVAGREHRLDAVPSVTLKGVEFRDGNVANRTWIVARDKETAK